MQGTIMRPDPNHDSLRSDLENEYDYYNDTITSIDCDQSQDLEERHKAPCYRSVVGGDLRLLGEISLALLFSLR